MKFWSETILKASVSDRHLPAILQTARPWEYVCAILTGF